MEASNSSSKTFVRPSLTIIPSYDNFPDLYICLKNTYKSSARPLNATYFPTVNLSCVGTIPFVTYFGRYSIMILLTHCLVLQIFLKIFILTGYSETIVNLLTFISTMMSYLMFIPLMKKYLPYVTAQKELL